MTIDEWFRERERRLAGKAQAALLGAAELIERSGWTRRELWPASEVGERYRPGVACCALGALAAATGRTKPEHVMAAVDQSPVLRRAVLALWEQVFPLLVSAPDTAQPPARSSDVAFWNDAPERTRDEVIAALRSAAARLTP